MKYLILICALIIGLSCIAHAEPAQKPLDDAITQTIYGEDNFAKSPHQLLNGLNYKADGGKFRAEIRSNDDCDLSIYDISNPSNPVLLVQKIGFLTCTPRTDVERLKITTKGSLQVIATWAESGVGRDRWDETVTIVHRDGKILVAGYTYKWRDSIEGDNHSCDVNYLSGREEVVDQYGSGHPIETHHLKITIPIPLLKDWDIAKDQTQRCKDIKDY